MAKVVNLMIAANENLTFRINYDKYILIRIRGRNKTHYNEFT